MKTNILYYEANLGKKLNGQLLQLSACVTPKCFVWTFYAKKLNKLQALKAQLCKTNCTRWPGKKYK